MALLGSSRLAASDGRLRCHSGLRLTPRSRPLRRALLRAGHSEIETDNMLEALRPVVAAADAELMRRTT
jgi:hypothetical protein